MTGSLVPDDMPSDPFREGQPDFGWLAGNNAAFLAAHVAAGMAEAHAVELTKVYLTFTLNVIIAAQSARQHPERQGEAPEA